MTKKEEEKIIEIAKKRLRFAMDSDLHNRTQAIEDLHFLHGDDQWESGERDRRKKMGRPCLQINVLPKFSRQVVGEMRRNKSQIKVRPVDSKGDIQIARIREGIIYSIEYLSNAESIYDHAAKMLVDCGYGAWRVLTRYSEENPFMLEIYLEGIPNPFTVYMDPEAKDQMYSDAKWAFVLTKMSKEDFKERYGDDKDLMHEFDELPIIGTTDEYWWDVDSITVAEYFHIENKSKTLVQLSDGQQLEKEEALEFIKNATEEYNRQISMNPEGFMSEDDLPKIAKEREVKEPQIKWEKLTAKNVIEEQDWAGKKYIPIILVTGERTNIEGKTYIQGLIRDAKDSQRLLNLWHTAAAEAIALAPKAPWVATPKMIEGFEDDYLNANEDNLPVLHYNIDPAAPNSKPERTLAAQPPVAIFSEISRAEQNIKNTIGMFNVDVGDTSGENFRDISGKAVMARQAPGDISTFIYPDNLNKGIAFCGKIINDLIPAIYDTERDARLRQADGTESFVPINTTVGKAMEKVKSNPLRFSGMDLSRLQKASTEDGGLDTEFNDISMGSYDIVVSTGPTFATQRMEAAENLLRLATAYRMDPVDKYFYLKSSDFPGADEYAEVVRKMIPPSLLPPREGDVPPPTPPTPPADQVALAKVNLSFMRSRTEQIKMQLEALKLQKELKGGDSSIKKEILSILQELEAPEHPADKNLLGGR